MKTLISTLVLFAGISTASFAQMKDRYAERPGDSSISPLKVEEMTRTMSSKLHLNEAQYIQLRAVNKIKLARVEDIQWEFHDDPVLRNSRLMELEAQYEQECSRILTPSQLSLFREEQKQDAVPTPPANANEGGLG